MIIIGDEASGSYNLSSCGGSDALCSSHFDSSSGTYAKTGVSLKLCRTTAPTGCTDWL
jgi:hypothetical protein